MVSDRDFIFHIYIPWCKTLSLVPKSSHLSRSIIKVTVFENMASVQVFADKQTDRRTDGRTFLGEELVRLNYSLFNATPQVDF